MAEIPFTEQKITHTEELGTEVDWMEDICKQRMERLEGDMESLVNNSKERKRPYSNFAGSSVNDLLNYTCSQ